MSRKTFDVNKFRLWVNAAIATLAIDDDDAIETRAALAIALEHVLHETDNYRGFNLLASEYLPTEKQTIDNVLRPDYDDTKRHYH